MNKGALASIVTEAAYAIAADQEAQIKRLLARGYRLDELQLVTFCAEPLCWEIRDAANARVACGRIKIVTD